MPSRAPYLLSLVVWAASACSPGDANESPPVVAPTTVSLTATSTTPSAPFDAIQSLLSIRDAGAWRAEGVDDIEVWICRVPTDSTAAVYAGLPLRLPLTAASVADILNARVTPYFESISHGLYNPRFHAGDDALLGSDQDPQVCVEQAIHGADDTSDAVLVVADAEHRPEFPGGFGNAGQPCPAEPPCPVLDSRRSAYVGASDFHPDWANQPPMDLVEHELGHTLGWPHSGFVDGADDPYQSSLDLMSDSAGPRDTDPTRRDGPNTLGINRLIAGWLGDDGLWVAPAEGGTVLLQPSTSNSGTRLVIIPVANGRFLTVEYLDAVGYNAHLPAGGGLAVHRVDVIEGVLQAIVPLVGVAPFTDLLQPTEFVEIDGWRIQALMGGVATSPLV